VDSEQKRGGGGWVVGQGRCIESPSRKSGKSQTEKKTDGEKRGKKKRSGGPLGSTPEKNHDEKKRTKRNHFGGEVHDEGGVMKRMLSESVGEKRGYRGRHRLPRSKRNSKRKKGISKKS